MAGVEVEQSPADRPHEPRFVVTVVYADKDAAAYSSGANCPVVLGRGKRLFEDGLATQWLTRLETNTYDDLVAVRYASAS